MSSPSYRYAPPAADATPPTPHRLPAYLQPPQLSIAEFAAARLDGEVFAYEDGYCSVDEPDTVRLRRDVLANLPGLRRATIAEMSAAWLYGAVLLAPRIHTGYVAATGRSANSPRLRLRQVGLRTDDTEDCGGLQVTTPTRTVADLARRTGSDAGPALEAIRGLFVLGLSSPREVITWVDDRRRVIGGSRIRRVVESAAEVPLPGLEPGRSELESWALPLSRR
ncbi:hypothetical protein KXS11_05230 [Plantibacter flavus]|uniref:hypothetical protein n=1 Tax=Plantibacter flavus TaxID=150123 RepID=UPI003F17BA45